MMDRFMDGWMIALMDRDKQSGWMWIDASLNRHMGGWKCLNEKMDLWMVMDGLMANGWSDG